jgi:hypothetical protein
MIIYHCNYCGYSSEDIDEFVEDVMGMFCRNCAEGYEK